MTKNVVFVAALLSLALLMSCSSAHSPNRSPQVSVTGPNGLSVLYVGQSVQFTATVQFSSDTSVNWSITNTDGSACTDPNTCGTLSGATSSTVTYNAPNQPESVNLVATLQSDSGV